MNFCKEEDFSSSNSSLDTVSSSYTTDQHAAMVMINNDDYGNDEKKRIRPITRWKRHRGIIEANEYYRSKRPNQTPCEKDITRYCKERWNAMTTAERSCYVFSSPSSSSLSHSNNNININGRKKSGNQKITLLQKKQMEKKKKRWKKVELPTIPGIPEETLFYLLSVNPNIAQFLTPSTCIELMILDLARRGEVDEFKKGGLEAAKEFTMRSWNNLTEEKRQTYIDLAKREREASIRKLQEISQNFTSASNDL